MGLLSGAKAALAAAWERVSTLGVQADEPGERRRLVLTNQSTMIGLVSCGSFALAYAIAGSYFRAPMIANLVAVVCFLGGLLCASRGAHTIAKVAVLLPANLVVVIASMLLGGRVGFVYYFFLFGAVAFLLFGERERALKWAL